MNLGAVGQHFPWDMPRAIPEPSTIMMLVLGLIAITIGIWKRSRG